jgi:tetratricopeptide (TPR) repeat protein
VNAAGGETFFRDKLTQIFEAIVLRCGSLRGMGKRCGQSNMWIWRQLRQNKSFDLVKAAKTFSRLQVPLRFFFEEAADALPACDPSWMLRHLRPGGKVHDPFLAQAQERIRQILDRPAVASLVSRRREIEALEEKCVVDPDAAKVELETLAGELLAAAGGGARLILADCARLLLFWSEAQSARGHVDDSALACALAWHLAEAAGERQVRGLFYLQGSRLLTDLGHPARALRFAQAACGLLQWGRRSRYLGEAIVQKSIALAKLGQLRESRVEALGALRLAARTDFRTRAAAWLHLAELAIQRGADRRALPCLRRAKKMVRGDRLKAIIWWREAVALGRLRRVPEAHRAFRAAIPLLKRHRPLDAARAAVDHLEMSLRSGRFQDAWARVRAWSPCFEQLGCTSRGFELWMDLCALLHAEDPPARVSAQIAELRRVLEETAPAALGPVAVAAPEADLSRVRMDLNASQLSIAHVSETSNT